MELQTDRGGVYGVQQKIWEKGDVGEHKKNNSVLVRRTDGILAQVPGFSSLQRSPE